ncbi:MAG: hemolysin family protein [Coriobacteriales bacterium]|jgi:putative hemolysin
MLTFICILITIFLILLNGYFSMAEMAMVNARKPKLQEAVTEGKPNAELALSIASDTDNMFAAIQVGITLVSFVTSAVSATAISDPIAAWLASFGIDWLVDWSGFIAVVFMTLLTAYFTLLFGELLPKRIAMADSERIAMKLAKSLSVFEKSIRPLVHLMSSSTNGVARLFGVKSSDDQSPVSEEEIKILVNEQDSLLDEEKRMIGEIFDLGDTVAREIMVPRVDMVLVEDNMTVKQVVERMRGTGFSRLPVFHEDHDKIVGIATVKDLLVPLMDDREDDIITEYMREPVFIPETKDILPLLSEMQNEHHQLAIVVDEYGGTAGLVSVEDIVEEVVGEIADEYDPDRKYITRLSDNELLVDGRLPVDDAVREGMKIEESDEYDTVAGWLMDAIDFIPMPGEEFTISNMNITVQSMRRKRISLLRVKLLEEPEEEEQPEEKDDE